MQLPTASQLFIRQPIVGHCLIPEKEGKWQILCIYRCTSGCDARVESTICSRQLMGNDRWFCCQSSTIYQPLLFVEICVRRFQKLLSSILSIYRLYNLVIKIKLNDFKVFILSSNIGEHQDRRLNPPRSEGKWNSNFNVYRNNEEQRWK